MTGILTGGRVVPGHRYARRGRVGGATTDARVLLDTAFTAPDLVGLRAVVAARAAGTGLDPERVQVLLLIASELTTNAVSHGGGQGRLRLLLRGNEVICQVVDSGPGLAAGAITDHRPDADAGHGRGLWLVRRFADGFSIEDTGTGVDVRASLRVSEAG
jgi:anti-sigma regulatory factor (Ser/Thr protein kinase)